MEASDWALVGVGVFLILNGLTLVAIGVIVQRVMRPYADGVETEATVIGVERGVAMIEGQAHNTTLTLYEFTDLSGQLRHGRGQRSTRNVRGDRVTISYRPDRPDTVRALGPPPRWPRILGWIGLIVLIAPGALLVALGLF